jgi:hypothetical protein
MIVVPFEIIYGMVKVGKIQRRGGTTFVFFKFGVVEVLEKNIQTMELARPNAIVLAQRCFEWPNWRWPSHSDHTCGSAPVTGPTEIFPSPRLCAQTSAPLCGLCPKTAAPPLFPPPIVCTASTCTTPPIDLIPSHCGFIEKEKFLCHRSTSALGPLHLRRVVAESPSRATMPRTSHCRRTP